MTTTFTRQTRILAWTALAFAPFLVVGCQQQMAAQPSFGPLDPCEFFNNGQSSRPLVAGTVARGHLRTDTALFTGRNPAVSGGPRGVAAKDANLPANPSNPKALDSEHDFVDTFPFPINEQVIEHGYHRYSIYCVVCHDPLGTGRGQIVERGYSRPPSYHIERLRNAPVGRLFAVISEGYGSMPSYAEQIPPRDRWAIVAYIRALQLSQHYPIESLTAEMRAELDREMRDSSPPRRPEQGAEGAQP